MDTGKTAMVKVKKTNWVHVEFYYDHSKFKAKHMVVFQELLTVFYMRLFNCTGKAFYLYQTDYFFFAFELRHAGYLRVFKRIVEDFKKVYLKPNAYPFIKEVKIKENSDD